MPGTCTAWFEPWRGQLTILATSLSHWAKFISGNKRTYSCICLLLSFLNIDMAQVVEILPCGKQGTIYKVNTMAADDLATQGARASAEMVLTMSSWNTLVSAFEKSTHFELNNWPTFCIQNFEMELNDRKLLHFDCNFMQYWNDPVALTSTGV